MIFTSFTMGDVEDPELYAAQPIYEWQQTEAGKFVMEHCKEPSFKITPDIESFGYRIVIYGELEEKDATFYNLKFT